MSTRTTTSSEILKEDVPTPLRFKVSTNLQKRALRLAAISKMTSVTSEHKAVVAKSGVLTQAIADRQVDMICQQIEQAWKVVSEHLVEVVAAESLYELERGKEPDCHVLGTSPTNSHMSIDREGWEKAIDSYFLGVFQEHTGEHFKDQYIVLERACGTLESLAVNSACTIPDRLDPALKFVYWNFKGSANYPAGKWPDELKFDFQLAERD